MTRPPPTARSEGPVVAAPSSEGSLPDFECLQWPVSGVLGVQGLFPVELLNFGSDMRWGPDARNAPIHRQSWHRAIGAIRTVRLSGWREQDGWTFSLSALLAFSMQWPEDIQACQAGLRAFLDHYHFRERQLFPEPEPMVDANVAPGVYSLGSEYWYEGDSLTVEQSASAHWLRFDQFQRWLDAIGEAPSEHVRAWISVCSDGVQNYGRQPYAGTAVTGGARPLVAKWEKVSMRAVLELLYDEIVADVRPTGTLVAAWLHEKYGHSGTEQGDWLRASRVEPNGKVPESATIQGRWEGQKVTWPVVSIKNALIAIGNERKAGEGGGQ